MSGLLAGRCIAGQPHSCWRVTPCRATTPHRGPSASRPVCFAAGSGGQGGVRVSFALPYRCNFGQHLCLVGSADPLGKWDVQSGVPMNWTDGDVWTVELDIKVMQQGMEVEYKYVVREGQHVVAWKPGHNFSLRLPVEPEADLLPEKVHVKDAWDGSFRELEVEAVRLSTTSAATAVGETQAAELRQQAGAQASTSGLSTASNAVEVLAESNVNYLAELDKVISQSVQLLEQIKDPTDPAILEADRMIAAAARKAVAISRALKAADPGRETRQLKSGRRKAEDSLDD
ncbi:hypothetical protein WJX72_007965 [[Myrmecia] bisecta]|uniref:CBM20 domain-containing protein n=1 Tax=[Myrmecia] bisecta TaxID=41462 RepID=A0AAW1PPH3_9CHLO